ncbi:MAG: hypothetical protein Q9169_008728, partial [Polycauliona sp. 2 TL-2023]
RPEAIPRRPKNALKKGLRPTENSDLPRAHESEDGVAATRDIYRRHSHSTVFSEDEEGTHSEPSPCKPRLMAPKMLANVRGKEEVMQNGAGSKVAPVGRKRKVVEILSDADENDDDDRTLYETTPPRPNKASRRLMKNGPTAPQTMSSSAPQEERSLGRIDIKNTPIQSLELKGPTLGTFIHSAALVPSSAANGNHNHKHIQNHNNQIQPTSTLTPPPTPSSLPTTTLRIYLPSSPSNPHQHPKTYFSLRLSSCPTSTILFQYVSSICDEPVQQLSVLRMHFGFKSGDGGEGGKGKGVMGVKKGVEESFVCFVQEVERREKEQGKGKGGNG